MRKLLLLSLTLLSLTANAQLDVFSEQLDRPATVDTARYKITYSLDYACHPQVDVRFQDVRDVLVGRHAVKDFSDVIFHYDSLATEDMRKGRGPARCERKASGYETPVAVRDGDIELS